MKKSRPLKVLNSQYVVKINGNAVKSFSSDFDTKTALAEARKYVANLSINDTIQNVTIVRETLTQTVLTVFTPKVQTVLTADDLTLE